jgi:hypothetical protein
MLIRKIAVFLSDPSSAAMAESVRRTSGDAFLTPRERAYARLLLLAMAAMVGALIVTAQGKLAFDGQPLGADFSQVYVAGLSVRGGAPALPYDNATHAARQIAVFGPTTPFFPWGYPPFFLLVAGLLAGLPYLGALALWQGAGLVAYLASLRAVWPKGPVIFLGLAFPAFAINLIHGQNGGVTAALMGAGAALLRTRPALAGLCFGLLAYKPQFGLLIPFALIAARSWRALLAATATVVLECAATAALLGPDVWRAFLESLAFSQKVVIEQGGAGWEKMQSVFAAVRALGGSIDLAYGFQAGAALACATVVVWLYGRRADFRLAGAALLTGALLSTPYCLDYDMLVIAPALALLASVVAERGALPGERAIMAMVFVAPLLARPIGGLAPIPLGMIAMAALMAAIVRRGLVSRAA